MIIKSLLDNDFYKFTVMNFAFEKYPKSIVEYSFTCRTPNIDFSNIYEKLKKEVKLVGKLTFSNDELNYLKIAKGHILKNNFLDYLKSFQLNPSNVQIDLVNDGALDIKIHGLWYETTLWEIIILSLVNELYYETAYSADPLNKERLLKNGQSILEDGINLVLNDNKSNTPLKFIEFGTRRRYSFNWQGKVVQHLKEKLPENMLGTSNLYLGMKYNIPVYGTHPHECFGFYQKFNIDNFQQKFLEDWYDFYGEDLSIALTDIYTTESFLNDFTKDLTSKFAGLRHDSGDPLVWFLKKIVPHYKKMNVDLKNKKIIFSDSLNFAKAISIKNTISGLTNDVYGIGTSLTNNMGVKSINIVIKLVKADNVDVIKISDEPTKAIGNRDKINQVMKKMGLQK